MQDRQSNRECLVDILICTILDPYAHAIHPAPSKSGDGQIGNEPYLDIEISAKQWQIVSIIYNDMYWDVSGWLFIGAILIA